MSEKRQLTEEDEKDILNKLMSSKLFQRVYQDVLSKVETQSCYKSLKNIGIHEISDFIETSYQDASEKEQKIRLCYSKIKVLTEAVYDVAQDISEKQFQNFSFVNEVREEVLKYVNEKLSLPPPQQSLNKNCVSGMRTEVKVEAEDGEDFDKTSSTSSFENFYKSDASKKSFSDASSDSVSSVHTSDLSSFDDEISISSDEDIGKKRRKISLKLAQEEIRKNKLLKESETDAPKEEINTHDDATHSKNSSSDPQGTVQKYLPRFVRKPNAKYASEDIISPFSVKQKESGKMSNGSSTKINSVPRKVGRKKKKAA